MNRKIVDDIMQGLAKALPQQWQSIQMSCEQQFRQALQDSLSKLSLVSREEFDVQAAVLAKTRRQLDALQTRLTELESQS